MPAEKHTRWRGFLAMGRLVRAGDTGYREHLASILPEVAPSDAEKVEWLREELIRLRNDHDDLAHLSWKLYLAGTHQTEESFGGFRTGFNPVREVEEARFGAEVDINRLAKFLDREFPQRNKDKPPVEWVIDQLTALKNQLPSVYKTLIRVAERAGLLAFIKTGNVSDDNGHTGRIDPR